MDQGLVVDLVDQIDDVLGDLGDVWEDVCGDLFDFDGPDWCEQVGEIFEGRLLDLLMG